MHPVPPSTAMALRSLALAYFVQATGALSVVGTLAAIAAEWHLRDEQAALLITVFGVTFALAAPLLQMAFGHLPRRRQVLIGLALFSTAAIIFALAPGYYILLAARIAMGLGAALIGPVLGALAAGLVEDEQQGSAIAMVLLGLSMAGLAGIPLATWAAQAWGPRTLFLAIGAAGLLTVVLIRSTVPAQAGGEKVSPSTLGRVVFDPILLPAYFVVFFAAAAVYATYAFLVPIIRDVFHGGEQTASLAMAVLGVSGVVGNLFVVRLARRYSADTLLVAGMAILGFDLMLLLVVPPTLAQLFGVLMLWAFATDIVWPSQQRRIAELSAQLRGVALAVTASFVFAGIALGSALAGFLYVRWGFHANLFGSLVLLALSWACLALSARRTLLTTKGIL
ncbi:MFS transporter [Pseudoduganella umbonata]|uniref:MFS transporter n=2 Tax=Pseudoduganella umbonata TaxID=864828 RepID=A0A4P8HP42_9BURK|nr:MFS transporter [Pseudoduganella umbonata]MBB3222609.1 putative MFS family arabinose efflux permease [Pseudoduganella umbonata]QCP10876.1 MFS transporter [Pseudoduganella umbonata]